MCHVMYLMFCLSASAAVPISCCVVTAPNSKG
jgi:hypothetical protein